MYVYTYIYIYMLFICIYIFLNIYNGLITQLGLVSQRNSVVVGSDPTQTNFL